MPIAPPSVFRRLIPALTGLLLACIGSASQAQSPDAASYPTKPIKMIVPYPPGGSIDIMARLAAQRLSKELGQPVVADNRPGAGGTIAAAAVARSLPDGYTFCACGGTALTASPILYPDQKVKPLEDFIPVMTIGGFAFLATVNSASPAKNMEDLLALARARGDKFMISALPTGTPSHLTAESFRIATGSKATLVPYKGSVQAVTAILAGEVDVVFESPSMISSHVKSGRLRALGVAQMQRLAEYPDVPTMAEKGLPGFSFQGWVAIVLPRATPAAVVSRLQTALAKAWDTPEARQEMESRGLLHFAEDASLTAARMKTDAEVAARLIQGLGIRIE